MQVILKPLPEILPKISIVLLDWSCRESYHMLHYLNNQTISRDKYEIIWIEYFSRRAKELDDILRKNSEDGSHPSIDKWLILGIPEGTYYHKHLMYNIGVVHSGGEIVVICDSDTIVRPTFVESILNTIETNKDIVLHLDEVRTSSRKFYPFNYPSFDEIFMEGCINWENGKTKGLLDKEDSLHTRNYGACFAALREDIVQIGGADEHIDFLGHICGPYDLTFRLANYGKTKTWHQSEFLFHTWHPGTDGVGNYLGPHDGKNMSTTSLETIRTGRLEPLLENSAIKNLRTQSYKIQYAPIYDFLIPHREISSWDINEMEKTQKTFSYFKLNKKTLLTQNSFVQIFKLLIIDIIFLRVVTIQGAKKLKHKIFGGVKRDGSYIPVIRRGFIGIFLIVPKFISRIWKNSNYVAHACEQSLLRLDQENELDISFVGSGPVVEILKVLVLGTDFKVFGVFSPSQRDDLRGFEGKVVIASFTGIAAEIAALEKIGIKRDQVVRLQ